MEKTWIEKQFRNNPTIEFCLDESRRIHEIFHQTPLHLAAKEVNNFFLIYFRHFFLKVILSIFFKGPRGCCAISNSEFGRANNH